MLGGISRHIIDFSLGCPGNGKTLSIRNSVTNTLSIRHSDIPDLRSKLPNSRQEWSAAVSWKSESCHCQEYLRLPRMGTTRTMEWVLGFPLLSIPMVSIHRAYFAAYP